MKKYILLLCYCCFANHLIAQNYPYYQQKNFLTEDITYSPNIRSILLYPYGNTEASLTPPIVPLAQQNLRLEFDDLNTNGTRYTAKIVSCDKDWQVTNLNNIEFLDVVNEFYITEREMSYNTKVPYQHYWLDVPAVKISGNYVLKVYENGYEDKLTFCRRFMITEGGVGIAAQQNLAIGGSSVVNNQQIDFQLNYGNYDIPNPMQQISVVIRQNYRWDNAIKNLQPTMVRDFDKLLEYRFFMLENNFQGGNEFRIFDLRNAQARGLGIDSFKLLPQRNEYYLLQDVSRRQHSYTNIFQDMNGRYYPYNSLANNGTVEADYMSVFFSLKTPQADGEVYIIGGLTDWQLNNDNRMIYNPLRERYEAQLLLKQGVYNYQYTLVKNGKRDDVFFEGTHQQTQNDYEIFVYYRAIGDRTDRLIGYKRL
jgi:hypothetical protein